MTRQEFLVKLEELLELDANTLTGSESLDSLPWDSLAIVSFIALVDENLELSLKAESVARAKSVGDLLSLVSL